LKGDLNIGSDLIRAIDSAQDVLDEFKIRHYNHLRQSPTELKFLTDLYPNDFENLEKTVAAIPGSHIHKGRD